jgi:hypothetical protein
MPIREHPERTPQRHDRQITHRQHIRRPTHLLDKHTHDPRQIPLISSRRVRGVLPRPPSREERLTSIGDQNIHADLDSAPVRQPTRSGYHATRQDQADVTEQAAERRSAGPAEET